MESNKKVFISYAKEDIEVARRLHDDLKKAGVDPWLDYYNILPGQRWKDVIERTIRECDFFLVLLSSKSISQRGFVQKELKAAFDVLKETPPERIFILPVRIDDVYPNIEPLKDMHWADLFPSYQEGFRKIISAINPYIIDRKLPLNEAKLILVGQGSVGKTSLIRRLIDENFNPQENKTEGIDIRKWLIPVNNKKIRLNIWDFGGQEIMHATHQFFLTRRSLYLLVLDARLEEEENRIEYWLKIIQSFGGDSPIIIVGNKIDQKPLDIDRRGLKTKYYNIKDIIETSCKSNVGITELKNTIINEVSKLEHIYSELLSSWFTIKDKLENMKNDFIPYKEYIEICNSQNVNDEISQQNLLRILHDLGIVLNFQDDPRLEDTNILNPEWVTLGVYKILNSNELFQSKGVLKIQTLNKLLDDSKYPKDKHMFIVDMMRKFELCFDFEGFKDTQFLVPDLLSKEEPFTGNWEKVLSFQYHYNVLPSSVISRFIVRMNSYISKNTYWRNGVVLENDNNIKALVKADIEDKIISILISGAEKERRNFLSIIRSHFETIHKSIPKIEAKEKIPLHNNPKIVIDYRHLLRLEKMGEITYIPEGTERKVNVKDLLNGIEDEQNRIKESEEYTKLIPYYWEKIAAYFFGIFFIAIMLLIGVLFPNPTDFQIFIFRVILALSASGIGAVIPGFLNIEMKKEQVFLIRTGGAIALFVIIYLINPPGIISSSK